MHASDISEVKVSVRKCIKKLYIYEFDATTPHLLQASSFRSKLSKLTRPSYYCFFITLNSFQSSEDILRLVGVSSERT